MTDPVGQLAKVQDVSAKVNQVYQKRLQTAQERFQKRVRKAYSDHVAALMNKPVTPWELWSNWLQYITDFGQRWVLFWETLQQRGNNFLEHELAGKPPVLHFQYEVVLDARQFERPVNYALLKILPPEGVITDAKRRPYVLIDPRAGHGPGIGGFKDESQVGVALHDGHPVYFVMFYPKPEPGQTLLDVCAAEQEFVRKVRELHPDSPKPVIVGNCQGGWAAMMLATSDPEITGPLVINGAPMSYWSGAWSNGEGDNPMRYSGGLLGGSWLASFAADLGNGIFDGASLVQNFENLNPANTFWDKYYHLFANIDKEPPRFLDFERWWGGFYLLNKEEIEWIVQNLFIGNKLWKEDVKGLTGPSFDLRRIKSPIILFASLGDNVTPPQQAFNWVLDVYHSTEEIKANGQVIVGLVHQQVGHLGIFVSGRVAQKEHAQIVSVLKSIEVLTPGLYAMRITEQKSQDGKTEYEVEFTERRLEDIANRVNRFKRIDEKPFEAVAKVSAFNQRAYETFAQPIVQRLSNEYTAWLGRVFHPLRVEHWAFSGLNPWLAWLGPMAGMVRAQRQPAEEEQPFRQIEQVVSEMISASLDYYRDLRDASSEATFLHVYGPLSLLTPQTDQEEKEIESGRDRQSRELREEALAAVDQGGYAAALCRAGYLLADRGKPLPLARLELKQELMKKYRDFVPEYSPYERRRIRGKQEIICQYELDKAIATLPQLLSDLQDRRRFLKLLEALLKDPQVNAKGPTREQTAMLKRIRDVLSPKPMPATG